MDANILFKAKEISKSFPGCQALKAVSLEIREGEIIGLVGENGAGKSTLLKIIIGLQAQNAGAMEMRGRPYAPKTPKEGNRLGVGMVFQEQSLVSNLTVGQNIFFGAEKEFRRAGLVNWKKMYGRAAKILHEIGVDDIKPNIKVRDLNFAKRQMVEISKILYVARQSERDKSLMLLDEPTSVLNDEEIKTLFTEIRKLKEEGHSIIFVSHRLDEVIEISDRVYVFKDGLQVGELKKENISESKLYELMVGRSSSGEYYKTALQKEPLNETVLEVKNLSLEGRFKDITFSLRKGEILGFCGVIGSGKEDVCAVLCGDEKPTSGNINFNGKAVRFNAPHSALSKGIISIPKERREEGVIGILSIFENITISNLDSLKRGGFISRKRQVELTRDWIEKLHIKCTSPAEEVASLSGGNAQKVVFARILSSGCKVFILNHPTRGVDVGAKEDIYQLIRNISAEGYSVILIGDTLDECIGLSNRIVVMKDGEITKLLEAPGNNKPEQIEVIQYMM